MRCVTSFGPTGYEQYGRKFLETYVKHVGLPIDVYIEEDPPDFTHRLVNYRPLVKVEGLVEFLTLSNFPAAQGHIWGEQKRNYRYDCHKFSRKCFAQIDAASRRPEPLYWIDADIEWKADFKPPKIPDDVFMLYLGRPDWHSCASFVGFNLNHEAAGEFFKRYWLLHMTGTIFCLPEWHDSFLLDWLRLQSDVPAINLADGLQMTGPANVFDEVFGEFGHHKKGKLKLVA